MLVSLPHLRIAYEDDLLDPARHQGTVDRLCGYLGLTSAPVSTELVKIAPPSLWGCISNYDEVRERLQSTQYACFLDDQ